MKGPIDEVELNRAKNLLKMNVMMALENSGDRLEEIARNFQTFGALNIHEYIDKINAVTSDQINRAATKCLAGKPTMVVSGGAVNLVPGISDVSRMLN